MAGDVDLATIRRRYAAQTTDRARRHGFEERRVEVAFATVSREDCLTPPPWRIFEPGGWSRETTSDPAKLYDDVLVVLDRKRGINNGQPSLHAAWMIAVAPAPGETVVQIGAGSGYYTAILAELVGRGGRVEAYEIESDLAARATENLAPWPQARVQAVSGLGELPEADVVYVAAGAAAPAVSWLKALRPGGRLVFPWQPAAGGPSLLVRRMPGGFSVRLMFEVSFIGCVGAEAAAMRMRGMPSRPFDETRSIRLRSEREPDESATAIYADLWFSAETI